MIIIQSDCGYISSEHHHVHKPFRQPLNVSAPVKSQVTSYSSHSRGLDDRSTMTTDSTATSACVHVDGRRATIQTVSTRQRHFSDGSLPIRTERTAGESSAPTSGTRAPMERESSLARSGDHSVMSDTSSSTGDRTGSSSSGSSVLQRKTARSKGKHSLSRG